MSQHKFIHQREVKNDNIILNKTNRSHFIKKTTTKFELLEWIK